jgi:hypothetical protein
LEVDLGVALGVNLGVVEELEALEALEALEELEELEELNYYLRVLLWALP